MKVSQLISTGSYLPQKVVTNQELAKMVDTSNEWILTRTGITQRHIAADNEFTSHMATKAAESALSKAKLSKDDIDLIIVATTTPDKTFPSTAAIIQGNLGIKNAAAFDIQAVCSGFIYALTIANSMIKSGSSKNALVIGAEKMSSVVDWKDRATCVLFGDGAGAVILSATPATDKTGIISHEIFADGSLSNILHTSGGVSSTKEAGHIVMQGREVFRHGVEKMYSSLVSLIKKSNLKLSDIDWFILHQANLRIIDAIAKKLGASTDKFILTLSKHANTSAASIPLALDAFCDKFKKGDNILLTAAGGGFTWGSLLLKW
jgi:3-oxoacyl-[acyl-carrier-protein] synthase III